MNKKVSRTLKYIRKELGHKSARSFYDEILQKGGSGFNYSYYMRIEKGSLPTHTVINSIADCLNEEHAKILIMSFCQSQFDKYSFLFDSDATKLEADIFSTSMVPKQKELTIRQVSYLIKSEEHYYLFLVLTLARKELKFSELTKYFKKNSLYKIIDDFKEVKIIYLKEKSDDIILGSACKEYSFPSNPSLKKSYDRMDVWDKSFSKKFNLTDIINKMMIRRISPRYVGIIEKQLHSVLEIVRSSDEVDQKFNNHVIHLGIQLRCGKVIG